MSIELQEDDFSYDIIQRYLLLKTGEIKKQQGFLKNEEDIKKVISYLQRSFVPRRHLSDPKNFKPAQKLLCSLKLYIKKISKSYVDRIYGRYKNIFHDYNLFDVIPDQAHNLKEILIVDSPVPINSAVYKRVSAIQIDDGDNFIEKKNTYQRVIQDMTKGHKFVDKKIRYRIKLKKKYKDKKELRQDLYKVYQNWYLSKKHHREVYIKIRDQFEMFGCRNTYNVLDNTMKKYYLNFELFNALLDSGKYPKRFSRILKTCNAIEKNKNIKNNTVVDSLVTDVVVVDKNKEPSYYVDEPKRYRFQFNARFSIFYKSLCNDIIKRGFLTENDFILKKDKNVLSSILNIDFFEPVFKKNLTRYFQIQKCKLIDEIQFKFLDPKELHLLFPKIKRIVKWKIKDRDFIINLKKDLINRGYLTDKELYKIDDILSIDEMNNIKNTKEMDDYLKNLGVIQSNHNIIEDLKEMTDEIRLSQNSQKLIIGKLMILSTNHFADHQCDIESCNKFTSDYFNLLNHIATAEKGKQLNKTEKKNLYYEKRAMLNSLRRNLDL